MKKLLILIVMMLTLVVLNAGEQSEYYFRFELKDLSRLPEIASLVSVSDCKILVACQWKSSGLHGAFGSAGGGTTIGDPKF